MWADFRNKIYPFDGDVEFRFYLHTRSTRLSFQSIQTIVSLQGNRFLLKCDPIVEAGQI